MTRNRWPLAIAAGAFTTAFIGGVALAGFQPFASADLTTVGGPTAALTEKAQPRDQLKTILDGLVAKGTITQGQEDAILQAIKDAAPTPNPKANPKPARPTVPNVMSFIGDLTKAASAYLGMDAKTLLTQLRGGKSVADLANGLSAQGKSAQGLIDSLTKTANDKLDQAVAANKLTADQATTLKPRIAAEITTFVNRSFTKPVLPRPLAPVKPSPSPRS
jgi:polyhydroxyalkanoate synthesis regulator phasin